MNLNLTKIIDKYFLPIPCFIIGLRKKNKIDAPKKILFIKMWSIGDGILTLPLIKAAKLKYPEAQIDVLSHKRLNHLFDNNKNISNLILFNDNLKEIKPLYKKYDLSIDTDPYLNSSALITWYSGKASLGFSHSVRSKLFDTTSEFKEQHTFQNYVDLLEKINIQTNKELEKIQTDNETKERVEEILKENNLDNFIVGISPGVGESGRTRMWPLEKFAKLIDYLIENKKAKIVIIDGPDNLEVAEKLTNLTKHPITNLAGKTTKKESLYLIEKCDLFISNDTGPMHMAAAQKTRTIGIFGPNTPIRWAPYGDNISIYKKTECSPCISNKKGITPECKYKGTELEQHCMKNITVEEVINQI